MGFRRLPKDLFEHFKHNYLDDASRVMLECALKGEDKPNDDNWIFSACYHGYLELFTALVDDTTTLSNEAWLTYAARGGQTEMFLYLWNQ